MRSQIFTNQDFRKLWARVEIRYEAENPGKKLIPSKHSDLVSYLRKFAEVKKHLPEPSGEKEGLAIYNAWLESQKPEKASPYIKLGNSFSLALQVYADGMPETPFTNYYRYLRNFFIKAGILNEYNLSLQDLYIEPRVEGQPFSPYYQKRLIDLITGWLYGDVKFSESYNNLLIILGDPGQGKTSFCYRLLHEVSLPNSYPVYFCRLRYISEINNFYNDPFKTIYDYLQRRGYDQEDDTTEKIPLTEDYFRKSILILDGLDELEKIHGLDKDEFCLKLSQFSKEYFRPFKIIITSRKEISVEKLKNNDIYYHFLPELNIEQQKTWLAKYNLKVTNKYILSNREIEALNHETSATHPLMRQPILLHIMAILNIRPSDSYNSSKVYDELFDRLVNRYWENNKGNLHPILKNSISSKEKLRSILHDLSLEMFNLNTTILNYKQIPFSIIEKIGLSSDNQIQAIKTLLIAFYFNNSNIDEKNKEYALEFIHKTFGEYLAAEGIWYKIKDIFSSENKPIEMVLHQMHKLFGGATFITSQINNYLVQIILNERETQIQPSIEQQELGKKMKTYIELLLKYDFFYPEETQQYKIRKSYQIFYGFASIFNRMGTLFSPGSDDDLSYRYFNFFTSLGSYSNQLDFRYMFLTNAIFKRAGLGKSNFRNANMRSVDLRYSDLSNTDLSNVNFEYANLENADLTNANLSNSNLSGAILKNAILTKVDLENADLSYTIVNHTFNMDLKRELLNVKSLFGCRGIPSDLQKYLENNAKHLLGLDS